MSSVRSLMCCAIAVVAGCGDVKDVGPGDAGGGGGVAVALSPESPHTGDDLVATISNGKPGDYRMRWRMNGRVLTNLTGATVGNALTQRDEIWKVELLDGNGIAAASDEVTILNSPPTAATVSVPAHPLPGVAIICSITGLSTDPDLDQVTYTASWTRNGAPFTGAGTTVHANDTIPAGVAVEGDMFECTVTASDGAATTPQVSTAGCDCSTAVLTPVTLGFTGGNQSYTVPAICVKNVHVEVWGAQGAGASGGLGGYAKGDLAVTPGQVLTIVVGGTNGFNGGGAGTGTAVAANGGGATDVRSGGTAVGNRIIVAGAGGGGPTTDTGTYAGGAGGGGTCATNYCGGGGGPGFGGAGGPGGVTGGTGFTATHGGGAGGGGYTTGGNPSCATYTSTTCGGTGGLGIGGGGGPAQNAVCYSTYGGTAGGGGGYYGGGGTSQGYCGGGAGGGGSSWTGALTTPVMTAAARTGNGQALVTPY